jgi:hypothetical protein
MTNNYFYLDGSYYKRIRGGAMGSPLTQTIANAYMYSVKRPVAKWANRTCSLYYRYIDDLFVMSNVHADILKGLVNFWNKPDINIELSESIGQTAEYLDVKLINNGGKFMSEVSHKPSHESYFPPYTTIHAKHIKKNIQKFWNDCFSDKAICNMKPIVGSIRFHSLQDYLVKKKPDKSLLMIDQLII